MTRQLLLDSFLKEVKLWQWLLYGFISFYEQNAVAAHGQIKSDENPDRVLPLCYGGHGPCKDLRGCGEPETQCFELIDPVVERKPQVLSGLRELGCENMHLSCPR